jgi:hypothetical protein
MAKKKKAKGKGKKTAAVTVPVLIAKSPKTNIPHFFANPPGWETLIVNFAATYQARIYDDLLKAVPFWNWLSQQPALTIAASTPCSSPLYRIVFGGLDPLSPAGSLAAGGRYNIGGAQHLSFSSLPGLQIQAALYCADTVNCANAEAGPFLAAAEIYKLTVLKPMLLWDIDQIISKYSWPNLQALVNNEPFNKKWILQKSPAISQLLGTFLRHIGGDGILSRSTKCPSGHVITLFVKDDVHCRQIFKAERV